ncbi:MAG: MFS transporter [Lachnospiraceae bacterium]|nr:MFS transporter [Lachnospiraceae bacterium]
MKTKTGNKYKSTLIACYMGFITQAIASNFAPLLFTTFHREFGISLGRIALISTVFYLTQLLIDLFCAKFVDRIGYRRAVVLSEIFSAAGLAGLALLPNVFPDPFAGIILCTVVYAMGSGLIEVLVSPIVEACPFDNKESVMSLLHSFYCWGSVGVIAGSTLFFRLFGLEHWRILAVIWALIPFVNIFNFLRCPIEKLVEDDESMTMGQLLKNGTFWLLCILMICAGASEIAMAQWASAFAESALGVTKSIGDIAGPCAFAVLMGTSRAIFGKYGDRMNLTRYMIFSGILCLCCYLLAGLASLPALGLLGCAVCGFSVGIMWPGSISISSKTLPAGGTAMFALLALAGDAGGTAGPSIVGMISQSAGDNLRAGVLSGVGFPLVLVIVLLILGRRKKAE